MRKTRPLTPSEPDAERHVETLEDRRAQLVGIDASGTSMAVSEFEYSRGSRPAFRDPSRAPRAASLRRGARDARKRAGRPSSCSIVERFAQAVQHVRRRRVRPEAACVRLEDRVPTPIRIARSANASTASSAFAETALKPSPGGSIKPFCEPPTRHVDAPLVVPVIDRRERRDRVDHAAARDVPRGRSPRERRARGYVTPVEVSLCTTITALNRLLAVGAQTLLDFGRIDAVPPIARDETRRSSRGVRPSRARASRTAPSRTSEHGRRARAC